MNFENIRREQEKAIDRFEDLRGKDISKKDLSSFSIDLLKTVNFDTETVWPGQEKLPAGFHPLELLEQSKNPGLGVRNLHEEGINGSGITMAIIDQKLDVNHPEYKDSLISYQEYETAGQEEISMHGPAVASLLTGKDCGIAPNAALVYKAVPSGRSFEALSQALEDIIKSNESMSYDKRVRVVSCSVGYTLKVPEPGLEQWLSSLKKAKENGIFVIDAEGSNIDIMFTGGGSSVDKDNVEDYSPWLWEKGNNQELNKLVSERDTQGIIRMFRQERGGAINISDSELEEKIKERFYGEEYEKEREDLLYRTANEIIIPSDYRTMASSWIKEGQYMYNGRGGISWSVPYLAGLFALALQINPDISQEELSVIINQTATVNARGLRIVNPAAIIDSIKSR